MADISFVTDRLAVGGAVESLFDARKIAAKGITHVLNLRMGDKNPEHVTDEVEWWHKAGVAYANNPTHDDGEKKPAEWFKSIIDFVFGALTASPENKVFIHCKEGINRSPSGAYACLQAWGTSAGDAEQHVMEARPVAELLYAKDADRAIKQLGYK